MIPVTEALLHVVHDLPLQPTELVPLGKARDRTLGEDIASPVSHPIFDQTAVDGYALRFSDLEAGQPLRLAGEIRAGSINTPVLNPGECLRIFTGAPVPPSADTVIMQEYTSAEGEMIRMDDPGLKKGGNIRRKGEQIEIGEQAMADGEVIGPAAIGFLASLGISEVQVRRELRVGILVTGDEFATSPEDLQHGKIFESNGQMLQTALARFGIEAQFQTVPDDLESTRKMIAAAANSNDVLLITGGVSVGDYDFTRPGLEGEGFQVVFHKVNQKPGKPLLYARKEEKAAFGLPGNPRSVMVAFYRYVLPHLHTRLGRKEIGLPRLQLPLMHGYRKQDDGKTHFVTGRLKGDGVEISRGLGSHMLQSFARANALIHLLGSKTEYEAGDLVTVNVLPQ